MYGNTISLQRLPTQNVEDLSRDELLRVYNSFIVPMPSRASSNSQRNSGVFKNFTTASSTNNAKSALVSVDDSNQLKRKINVRTKISNDETVMDDSKRPRVGFHSKEEPSRTTNKRPINDDNYVVGVQSI